MKTTSVVLTICAVLALGTTVVLAKRGSIGIYAIVDEVELQPTAESPERIVIRGVFVVPVPLSSGDYQPPKLGYLHFTLPPENAHAAIEEWQQLKSLAGTGRGFGFAPYWEKGAYQSSFESLQVRVHVAGDVAPPDVYPEPRGIVETGDKSDPDFEPIVAQLREAALH